MELQSVGSFAPEALAIFEGRAETECLGPIWVGSYCWGRRNHEGFSRARGAGG